MSPHTQVDAATPPTRARLAAVVVLAAGGGTRMRSATPKVLHMIGGRTLLGHAIQAARGLDPEHLVVVVRHGRDAVAAHVADVDPAAAVADQDDVPGTGRAVQCGLAVLPDDLAGTVVVTYGDVPLLTSATLDDLVRAHEGGRHAVTVVTAKVPDPTGYGRVLRDTDGMVTTIVEQHDATPEQQSVTEINSGIYAFDAVVLADALNRLNTDNAQGQRYLTDVLAIARRDGRPVLAHRTTDVWQTEGVNDRVQLAAVGAELNRRVLDAHMRAGATVVDPATTWVDVGVRLARDVTLLPGTQLYGSTTVDDGATVGPDTTLRDCVVGSGAKVVRSHCEGAEIGARADVGPFSYLRPGTRLGESGKIGGFVETKNAVIGQGSKVPHLSYVGDAEIGEGSNIGAATVFVNYDGVEKHRTVVGDHVRVGSDTMLVAPVTVGDGAYTAAGSVIDADVPPGAIAVARARQRNIEGWVERRRAGSPSAEAAARARTAAQQDAPQDAPTDPTPRQDPPEGAPQP